MSGAPGLERGRFYPARGFARVDPRWWQFPSGAVLAKYHAAVRETKKQLIVRAVQEANGNYKDAAQLLGVHPNLFAPAHPEPGLERFIAFRGEPPAGRNRSENPRPRFADTSASAQC